MGVIVKHPITYFCHVCALIKYWTGLFGDDDRKILEDGVNIMLQIATRLMKEREKANQPAMQQVEDGVLHSGL